MTSVHHHEAVRPFLIEPLVLVFLGHVNELTVETGVPNVRRAEDLIVYENIRRFMSRG